MPAWLWFIGGLGVGVWLTRSSTASASTSNATLSPFTGSTTMPGALGTGTTPYLPPGPGSSPGQPPIPAGP